MSLTSLDLKSAVLEKINRELFQNLVYIDSIESVSLRNLGLVQNLNLNLNQIIEIKKESFLWLVNLCTEFFQRLANLESLDIHDSQFYEDFLRLSFSTWTQIRS